MYDLFLVHYMVVSVSLVCCQVLYNIPIDQLFLETFLLFFNYKYSLLLWLVNIQTHFLCFVVRLYLLSHGIFIFSVILLPYIIQSFLL